jgi:Ca-activated chloride channel family protein
MRQIVARVHAFQPSMNRTTLLLSSAGLLLLLAVVVGLPRTRTATTEPTPLRATGQGSLTLSGALARPWVNPGASDVFATLDVSAADVPGAHRAPVNLALVIDRSGSMAGAKLEGARQAALRLVDLLDEHDRLSISHYGSDVVTLPASLATPAAREEMAAFIRAIDSRGGTNLGEGLTAGKAQLDLARGEFPVNRLVLLSDGQPTVGMVSPQGLTGLVASFRQGGVTVTSLGVGADFNEDLMQRLADVGGGSYAFIRENEPQAMARLFAEDLQQAGTVVARGATLSFAVSPGVELAEVYGRTAVVEGGRVRITLPDFSARQHEKLVVHLRARVEAREGSLPVGQVQLDYQDVLAGHPAGAELALAAEVTTDRQLALRPSTPEAVVQVTQAQAAANYQEAAVALDRGDAALAQQALAKNDELFQAAEALAGPGSVALERKASAAMFSLSAAPPEARSEAVKRMKVQSLKSAGRGASVRE